MKQRNVLIPLAVLAVIAGVCLSLSTSSVNERTPPQNGSQGPLYARADRTAPVEGSCPPLLGAPDRLGTRGVP